MQHIVRDRADSFNKNISLEISSIEYYSFKENTIECPIFKDFALPGSKKVRNKKTNW